MRKNGDYGQLILVGALLAAAPLIYGQSGILGTNLIVNGNAESGPAGMDVKTPVASIPGWTVQSGKPTVLPYNLTGNLTGYVQLSDPAPPDHGFQYFAGAFPSNPGTISQNIDVSSAASLISAGSVKFTASAYLGSTGSAAPGEMDVAFKNANGQTFSTTKVGPLSFPFAGADSSGMFFQQQIGLVPSGTVSITVLLILPNGNYDTAVADSLSLVLTQLSTTSVIGHNLIANPGAEQGPAAVLPTHTLYVPAWSTAKKAASVCPYGGSGWVATTDPGPADRGVNSFCGWQDSADLYQDVDVSAAASAIDAGQVNYEIGAWLGGVGAPYANLSYVFNDWTGKQLAPTAQLAPNKGPATGFVSAGQSGPVPAGTRWVRISLNFPSDSSVADDIEFTLAGPSGPPVISETPGVISASGFGGSPAIAPGIWIEIYGMDLTSGTLRGNCPGFAGSCWTNPDFNNGVAPTSLDGVSVSVGGKAAFIDFTSPGQINALVPSNAPVGPSMISVTNANGTSDPFPIYINQTQPGLLAPSSFLIGGKQYVAAILSDGSFALPQNAIPGVASRPAKAGETIVIYGVGFGPVTPASTAGTVVTQQNQLATPLQFLFNTIAVTPAYYGLAPNYTGLYQFNIVVPNAFSSNTLPLSFNLGGVTGTQTLYIAVN